MPALAFLVEAGGKKLHALPSQIGEVAARAGATSVVLSHLMQRALDDKAESLQEIKARCPGPVRFAEDGLCLTVP